jgi:hypothetical protein
MTVNELREKAKKCRQRAGCATGDKYHREMQRAQALETEANDREAWLHSKKNHSVSGVQQL